MVRWSSSIKLVLSDFTAAEDMAAPLKRKRQQVKSALTVHDSDDGIPRVDYVEIVYYAG